MNLLEITKYCEDLVPSWNNAPMLDSSTTRSTISTKSLRTAVTIIYSYIVQCNTTSDSKFGEVLYHSMYTSSTQTIIFFRQAVDIISHNSGHARNLNLILINKFAPEAENTIAASVIDIGITKSNSSQLWSFPH